MRTWWICLMVTGLVLGLVGGALGAVTVRPGETLSDIAARNGTSVAALARANGITDPDRVVAGTTLRLTGGGGAAPTASGGVVVGAGETLSAIAARHGTTAAALAAANGIADPDMVVAGTRLVVSGGAAPAPAGGPSGGYTVRPGETLSAIAARHGTSVAALARANGIADPDRVVAGTRLTIGGGGGGGTAATAVSLGAPSAGVADLIASHAAAHGVDPALARAVAWQESGWSQAARSGAGAIGVMQLMPDTARWFGPSVLGRRIDPYSLEQNVEAGVAYLGWLQRQSGSRDGALAAYYQGLTSVRRRGTLPETDRYVANVLAQVGRR